MSTVQPVGTVIEIAVFYPARISGLPAVCSLCMLLSFCFPEVARVPILETKRPNLEDACNPLKATQLLRS